jgi:hypothetical protein
MTNDTTYNGWTNYETWKCALYLDNDYETYRKVVAFAKRYNGDRPYVDLITALGLLGRKTPDGVLWLDPRLNEAELNAKVLECADD